LRERARVRVMQVKEHLGTGLVELAKSRDGGVFVRVGKRTATRFDKLTVLSKVEGRAVPAISSCSVTI